MLHKHIKQECVTLLTLMAKTTPLAKQTTAKSQDPNNLWKKKKRPQNIKKRSKTNKPFSLKLTNIHFGLSPAPLDPVHQHH